MALFSKPTARALAIIDLLMMHPNQAFGLTEMTRRLGLNKATCHAILTTMTNYGFLVQDPKSKAYRLGPSIVAAGHAAFAQFPVLEYARPELEKLARDLDMGCGATGRSGRHIVLLAHYGNSSPFHSAFQLGTRLPNAAPLGASFIAWSPAPQLESWLKRGQQAAPADERLDQRLRLSVVAIRARGFEVTLKTRAERELVDAMQARTGHWELESLEEAALHYQRSLFNEQYHLDRIDGGSRYPVCNITVPVFGSGESPELVFATGSIERELSGNEIIAIAERLQSAANRVTQAASRAYPQLNSA